MGIGKGEHRADEVNEIYFFFCVRRQKTGVDEIFAGGGCNGIFNSDG